jgi:hypothetical protein
MRRLDWNVNFVIALLYQEVITKDDRFRIDICSELAHHTSELNLCNKSIFDREGGKMISQLTNKTYVWILCSGVSHRAVLHKFTFFEERTASVFTVEE